MPRATILLFAILSTTAHADVITTNFGSGGFSAFTNLTDPDGDYSGATGDDFSQGDFSITFTTAGNTGTATFRITGAEGDGDTSDVVRLRSNGLGVSRGSSDIDPDTDGSADVLSIELIGTSNLLSDIQLTSLTFQDWDLAADPSANLNGDIEMLLGSEFSRGAQNTTTGLNDQSLTSIGGGITWGVGSILTITNELNASTTGQNEFNFGGFSVSGTASGVAVPEPATVIASSLIAFAFFARRRRKQKLLG